MSNKKIPPITNPDVARIFAGYTNDTRDKLMRVRALILETAANTTGVGMLEECLKWGEPSYLTTRSKSGSTIRIDAKARDNGGFGLYFNCQTSLIDSFKNHYGDKLTFGSNRAILFKADDEIPMEELRHCISMALTYHLDKRR